MKPGWKTSEFWVTAFVILGAVVTQLSSLNVLPQRFVGIAVTVATAAYAISRGIAKLFPPKAA